MLQIISEYEPEEAYDPQRLRALARGLSPEDVQLYYQIALSGQKELDLAPDPRSGFEMVLLRLLAFRPDLPESTPVAGGRGTPAEGQKRTPDVRKAQGTESGAATSGDSQAVDPSDWGTFVKALNLGGITSQLAHHCAFGGWDGETLRLTLDASMKQLRVGQSERRLQESINRVLGRETKLLITEAIPEGETPAMRLKREQQERQREAEEVMMSDPLVREMEERFSARLLTDSIRPMDDQGK
jgi:DNA polymerase-3 subunit gamma/tau